MTPPVAAVCAVTRSCRWRGRCTTDAHGNAAGRGRKKGRRPTKKTSVEKGEGDARRAMKRGETRGERKKERGEQGISKLTAGAKCYAKPNKEGNKRKREKNNSRSTHKRHGNGERIAAPEVDVLQEAKIGEVWKGEARQGEGEGTEGEEGERAR